MREAFGGLFMIRLMLVFIVIYVAFAAISLNYAKAFRIKNKVISYIEATDIQGFEPLFAAADTSQLSELGNMLGSYRYNITCEDLGIEEGMLEREDELIPPKYCYHGVIIEENEEGNIIHYNVSTYVNWNLNFMNRILMLAGRTPTASDVVIGFWSISGEAKVVKRTES